MRIPIALIIFVALLNECYGQESPQHVRTVELSQVSTSLQLDSLMMIYFDNTWGTDFISVPMDAYSPPPQKRGPQWWYSSYFRFAIHNDTKREYDGLIYVAKTGGNQVVRVNQKGEIVQLLEASSYDRLFEEKYFTFSIPADSTWHLVIHSQSQREFMHVSAWIVKRSMLDTFMKAYTFDFIGMIFLHCIIGGMMAMMLVYVLSQFALIRTAEYGYYAAYIFTMLVFLLTNAGEVFEIDFLTDLERKWPHANELVQLIAYCLYFAFLAQYTKAKTSDPLMYRVLRIAIVVLLIYIVTDQLSLVTGFLNFGFYTFTPLRLALVLLVIFLAYRVWNLDQPYARYPIYGGLIFMLFALAALMCATHREWRTTVAWPFGEEMFYYFVGVIFELTFFTLGLANKRRQDAIDKVEAQEALKLEVERQRVRHLNALSEVQESERSRFAKDLHDGLGGMLSGVKLSLSNMKGNVVLNNEYVDVFERALDMLDNSIHELRRVAHNLMPESLVKFGLAASLKDFCDFINSSKVIHVIFQQIGDYKRLEMSSEIVLYRIANELVNNALRHASATELIIQLNYDDSSLTLTVEDNGKGFDRNILERTTGSGWPNIKSRVAYLKGTLDVQTSPGNGTSVNITIPV